MRIKKYFEALSFIQKVELYLIVLMGYFLVVIFFDDVKNLIPSTQRDTYTQNVVQQDTFKKEKIHYLESHEIISLIDNMSKENNISIKESEILNNSVYIKIEGSYDNVIHSLDNLQNNFEIKNFEILYENKITTLSVSFNRKYSYKFAKESQKNEKIANPFYQFQNNMQAQISMKPFQITAILDDEILVDGSWYKKSNMIYDYKILSISPREVILKHSITQQKITKKVTNE
ncbi:MAG: hypothetical protein WBG69_05555 [Arcobacteraceae bacterium]